MGEKLFSGAEQKKTNMQLTRTTSAFEVPEVYKKIINLAYATDNDQAILFLNEVGKQIGNPKDLFDKEATDKMELIINNAIKYFGENCITFLTRLLNSETADTRLFHSTNKLYLENFIANYSNQMHYSSLSPTMRI